jgi:HSP20 family protein
MPITDMIPWRRREMTRRGERDLTTFEREMDRLFEDFFRGRNLAPFGESWGTFSPSVDVVESENEIKVSAELPGMSDEDIDVSLDRGMLTIRGEKTEEQKEERENYYRAERTYGSFQRSIPLPTAVKEDQVEAVFQNGVLTITLPKAEVTEGQHKIQVKAGQ